MCAALSIDSCEGTFGKLANELPVTCIVARWVDVELDSEGTCTFGEEVVEGCIGRGLPSDGGGTPDCWTGESVCVRTGPNGTPQVGAFPLDTCAGGTWCGIELTVDGGHYLRTGPEECLCGCEINE